MCLFFFLSHSEQEGTNGIIMQMYYVVGSCEFETNKKNVPPKDKKPRKKVCNSNELNNRT